jgi:NADH-quinone oxidoreductase subunit L
MEQVITIFIGLPFLGFLVSLFIRKENEARISTTAFVTTGVLAICVLGFSVWWLVSGAHPINLNEVTLYRSDTYVFFIDLYFDKVTLVYLLFSSFLAYLITMYSRTYLHRESGYKRFFNTMLLFVTGLNIIVLSGNFETLFVGWEIVGVSSFLLIGYYRHRYLPVRNALKVYSIYRLADIGLLIAMWLMHHLYHSNITFLQLNDLEHTQRVIAEHPYIAMTISFAIILAASAKSAQFPFSSWLPRAMEGPTASTAIFYGSVAVHLGVYLLLRTYPFWSAIEWVKWNVVAMGITTAIIAAVTAKVQISVKAQIAYSSITQIGIIFVEVALGFHWLALIHMSGNAFLRAYQLLISPSVVTYMIREQFFSFVPTVLRKRSKSIQYIQNSLFVIGLKEWKLDGLMYSFLWNPIKQLGRGFQFLKISHVLILSGIVLAFSSWMIATEVNVPTIVNSAIPEILASFALVLVIRAFTERKNPFLAWGFCLISHFWLATAVGFNETFSLADTVFYLNGVLIAGIVGYFFLKKLARKETFDLSDFHGHSYEHKWLSLGFLLACLALSGFPITTTFLGEDLLFTHIHENQILLASLVSLNFVIVGIALMRMYSRIYLGPHKRAHHPVPLRDA